VAGTQHPKSIPTASRRPKKLDPDPPPPLHQPRQPELVVDHPVLHPDGAGAPVEVEGGLARSVATGFSLWTCLPASIAGLTVSGRSPVRARRSRPRLWVGEAGLKVGAPALQVVALGECAELLWVAPDQAESGQITRPSPRSIPPSSRSCPRLACAGCRHAPLAIQSRPAASDVRWSDP
jgi:hypothetical protein